MTKKFSETNKSKLIFPDDMPESIDKILNDFGLKKIEDDELKKAGSAKDPKEIWKILSSLPGRKIADLVYNYTRGKISPNEFIELLKKDLKIDKETAEKIARELNDKIIKFVKTDKENKIPKTFPEQNIKKITEKEVAAPPKKQSDSYLESIE